MLISLASLRNDIFADKIILKSGTKHPFQWKRTAVYQILPADLPDEEVFSYEDVNLNSLRLHIGFYTTKRRR